MRRFAGVMLSALGVTANSAVQAIASKRAGLDGRAHAMAVLFVMENPAKGIGPVLHLALYVVTLPFCPPLVYYVIGGEGALLVVMAAFMSCNGANVSRWSGVYF